MVLPEVMSTLIWYSDQALISAFNEKIEFLHNSKD